VGHKRKFRPKNPHLREVEQKSVARGAAFDATTTLTAKEKVMKALLYPILLTAALGLTLVFTGCEKRGPAEKAGEQIDETMEETQEAVEETVDEATDSEGPAEKAGEKIDEAMEETEEKVEETIQ
jgi:hypothetical protein